MKRICCQCGKDLVPSEKCGKCGSLNVLQPVGKIGVCRCLDCPHVWEKGSELATHGICERCKDREIKGLERHRRSHARIWWWRRHRRKLLVAALVALGIAGLALVILLRLR